MEHLQELADFLKESRQTEICGRERFADLVTGISLGVLIWSGTRLSAGMNFQDIWDLLNEKCIRGILDKTISWDRSVTFEDAIGEALLLASNVLIFQANFGGHLRCEQVISKLKGGDLGFDRFLSMLGDAIEQACKHVEWGWIGKERGGQGGTSPDEWEEYGPLI